MKKGKRFILIALAIIMLLALTLSFDATSQKAGEILNVAGDRVKDIARTVLGIAVGLFLISSGVAAMTVPVVGITLIAVGVALVAYSAWPLFKKNDLKD